MSSSFDAPNQVNNPFGASIPTVVREQHTFHRSGSLVTTGTNGLIWMGVYDPAGSNAGTHQCPIYTDFKIKRVMITSNGPEFSGGTLNGQVYNGGTLLYESGAIAAADFEDSSGAAPAGQRSCTWVSPELDIDVSATPSALAFLTAAIIASGVTGGPEGACVTVVITRPIDE